MDATTLLIFCQPTRGPESLPLGRLAAAAASGSMLHDMVSLRILSGVFSAEHPVNEHSLEGASGSMLHGTVSFDISSAEYPVNEHSVEAASGSMLLGSISLGILLNVCSVKVDPVDEVRRRFP